MSKSTRARHGFSRACGTWKLSWLSGGSGLGRRNYGRVGSAGAGATRHLVWISAETKVGPKQKGNPDRPPDRLCRKGKMANSARREWAIFEGAAFEGMRSTRRADLPFGPRPSRVHWAEFVENTFSPLAPHAKKSMTQHDHGHQHGHHHDGAHTHKKRGFHKDWRVWAVVLLMLATMAMYVISFDESHPPDSNVTNPEAPAAL